MRGVWILLEHMKWKKGTDGSGVGGKGEERVEEALSPSLLYTSMEGGLRERPHFIQLL